MFIFRKISFWNHFENFFKNSTQLTSFFQLFWTKYFFECFCIFWDYFKILKFSFLRAINYIFLNKRDKSGFITTDEFKTVLKTLGCNASEQYILKLLKQMDIDGNEDFVLSFLLYHNPSTRVPLGTIYLGRGCTV